MFKSRKVKRLEREVRALINNAENARHREQAAMAMLSKYMKSNRALQKGCRRLSRKNQRLRKHVEALEYELAMLQPVSPFSSDDNHRPLKFTVPAGVNGMEAE